MNYAKVLYKDGDKLRILKGVVTDEDETFLTVSCELNNYRLNKGSIISIKKEKKMEEQDGTTQATGRL